MKILITAKGKTLDSSVDERFGRAAWFLMVDSETMEVLQATENPNLNDEHGVGIKTATFVLEQNPSAVLTKVYGPKAYDVLKEGTAKLYLLKEGTVRETLEAFKAGQLEEFKG